MSTSTGTGAGVAHATLTFDRGDQVELAHALLARLAPGVPTVPNAFDASVLTWDDGEFWRYSQPTGIWEPQSLDHLKAVVASFAGSPVITPKPKVLVVTSHTITGTIEIARALLASDPHRPRFASASPGVAFVNGFVMLQDGKITVVPHAPMQMSRARFAFDFAPGAPHPLFDAFLEALFADAEPADRADRILLLQQFLGACLMGIATTYQRALVLHGEGGNGKSQLIEIAQALFPPSAVASLPPQLWGRRFQIASLVGVRANLCNEIPETEIVSGELFKSVVTGEAIHAERKNQHPFGFRPTAGHIFAANTLPATADQSHGFWRRFLVCSFTRDMEAAADHAKDAAKPVIAGELPAIAAWAVEGAAKLQRAGEFVVPTSSRDLVERWRGYADSVRRFVAEQCVVDPLAALPPHEFYCSYSSWAAERNLGRMSDAKFFRRLKGAGIRPEHTRTGNIYRLRVRLRDVATGRSWPAPSSTGAA